MGRPSTYATEVCERAVRLVHEHASEYRSPWAAIRTNRHCAADRPSQCKGGEAVKSPHAAQGGRVGRLVYRVSTIPLIVVSTPDQNSSERARLISSGMLSSTTDRTTLGPADSMRNVQFR